MKKNFIALAMAAVCFAGTASVPAFAASKFADINDVPWSGAEQYINQAADLGLMAGYTENGKLLCKARNNVTYCEAVQLMYSIMTANDTSQKVDSMTVSRWMQTMQNANIPSWAYEAVAYGLENSILTTNDISIFVRNGKQGNARREDVGVIFGKALAKKYALTANPTLTYNDKDKVASTSVAYLELLNRLNLMVGDSSNNFNPKANINRAEMAVLSTKTYNKLKENGSTVVVPPVSTREQFTGVVSKVDANGSSADVTVTVDKKDKTIKVDSSTVILKNNEYVNASKISEGDTVVAVVENNKVTFLTILYSTGKDNSTKDEIKGDVKSITTKKISIEQNGKSTSYTLDKRYEDVVVKLDGSSSDVDELIKLYKDGYTINAKITLDKSDYVTRIDATKSKPLTGEITSLSKTKITIEANKNEYSYNLPDDTDDIKVTLDGSSSTYSKLKSAVSDTTCTATITLNSDNEVSKIVAKKKASSTSSTVSGELVSISKSTIKIKKSDDSKKTYDLDDDVTVTIDGSSSKLSTLISRVDDDKEYDVKLTISKNDKVTKIAATLSKGTSTAGTTGTLVDADYSDGIKIKSGSSTKWYEWATAGYEIKLNGSYSNIDKLLDKKKSATVTVKLTLNGADRVTYVEATTKDGTKKDELEGQITSLSSSKITIKTDSGSKKTYTISDEVSVSVDGDIKSIKKLKNLMDDNDYTAKLTLNSDDEVKRIVASSSMGSRTGKLVSIDKDKIKLTVGSTTYSYDISSGAKVKVDGDDMELSKFINIYVMKDYTVTITRNAEGKATKIVATSK